MTAPDHELAQICQSCGFCCDGTLFRGVLLRPEELDRSKRIGLRVHEDKGFLLPCSQLKDKSCQVYEDRPSTCRSFECSLLARHREEGGPVEQRLRVVERVRELSKILEPFGFERTRTSDGQISAEGPDGYAAMSTMHELMTFLDEHFSRATRKDPPPVE